MRLSNTESKKTEYQFFHEGTDIVLATRSVDEPLHVGEPITGLMAGFPARMHEVICVDSTAKKAWVKKRDIAGNV